MENSPACPIPSFKVIFPPYFIKVVPSGVPDGVESGPQSSSTFDKAELQEVALTVNTEPSAIEMLRVMMTSG